MISPVGNKFGDESPPDDIARRMVELAADPCRVSELVAESIEAARAWYEFRHQKMAVWRDGGVHLIEPKDFSFRGGKAPTAN